MSCAIVWNNRISQIYQFSKVEVSCKTMCNLQNKKLANILLRSKLLISLHYLFSSPIGKMNTLLLIYEKIVFYN